LIRERIKEGPKIRMRQFAILVPWMMLLLAQNSIYANADDNDNADDTCSLYLAESSIPDAGWGVYAARNYKMGDRIVSKMIVRISNII
jgi:hypothetical protein